MAEQVNSWDRQADERDKPWAAFVVFRDMGKDRNLLQAYRDTYGRQNAKKAPGWYAAWAKKHDWRRRAAAWDAHLDQIAQDGVEDGVEEQGRRLGVEWRVRRSELMEVSARLLRKAEQMLDFPIARQERTTQTDEDGNATEIVIVNPARFTFSTAAKLAEASAKLGAIAAEKSLDPHRFGMNDDADIAAINSEKQKAMQRLLADPESRAALDVLAKKTPTPNYANGVQPEPDDDEGGEV